MVYERGDVDPELKTLIFDVAQLCMGLSPCSIRRVFEYVQEMTVLDCVDEQETHPPAVPHLRLVYSQRERERERERERKANKE